MRGKIVQNLIKKYSSNQCENGNQNNEGVMKWVKEKYRQHEGKLIVTLITALLIGSYSFYAEVTGTIKQSATNTNAVIKLTEWQHQQVILDTLMLRAINELRDDLNANTERQAENYRILRKLCEKNNISSPEYKLR